MKYDGAWRTGTTEDFKVGGVIRRVDGEENIAAGGEFFPGRSYIGPFADTVIIAITATDKRDVKHTFPTLRDAIESRCSHDTIQIELARPYLYCNSIGICSSWLQGVENFKTDPGRLIKHYKVVLMSTELPATMNLRG